MSDDMFGQEFTVGHRQADPEDQVTIDQINAFLSTTLDLNPVVRARCSAEILDLLKMLKPDAASPVPFAPTVPSQFSGVPVEIDPRIADNLLVFDRKDGTTHVMVFGGLT